MDNLELRVCSQAPLKHCLGWRIIESWRRPHQIHPRKDMKFVTRNRSWKKYHKLKCLQNIDIKVTKLRQSNKNGKWQLAPEVGNTMSSGKPKPNLNKISAPQPSQLLPRTKVPMPQYLILQEKLLTRFLWDFKKKNQKTAGNQFRFNALC